MKKQAAGSANAKKWLLEQTGQADGDTRTPTKRAPRSIDIKVSKIPAGNFKTWPAGSFDNMVDPATGYTLRERVRNDKVAGATMGKLYYTSINKPYGPQGSIAKQLKATNTCDAIDADLDRAIAAYNMHRSRPQYIREYFRDAALPNEMCLVAVMCFLLAVPVSQGIHHLALVMDGLRWMARVGIAEAFPEKLDCINPQIDQVLLRSWQVWAPRRRIGVCWSRVGQGSPPTAISSTSW